MITQHTHTLTYEQAGQRVRDQVTSWRLLGFIPLYTKRAEVWRKAADIADALRRAVFEADSYQCVYCGSTERHTLTLDHRIPQSQGGGSTEDNLLTACRSCNSAKNGRTPEEANMSLTYGRYYQAVELVASYQTGYAVPEARRAAELFMSGMTRPADLVRELRGVSSNQGARYQVALAEVMELVRQGIAGA